jgi:phosphohistidine swiveling domain-containing protein
MEKFLRPVVDQARESRQESIEKNNDWLNERESFSNALSTMGIIEDPDTVERFLRGAIEGREYAKFIFSRNLSAALDLISEYGKIHGLNRTQLANISLGSLFALRSGNISSEDAFTWLINESNSYSNSHDKTNRIELPPLITTESDFNIFMYPSSQPNYVGSGRVSAEVATLSSEDVDQDNSFLDQKILLIPQADPGFDWIFGHNIAGLVTMYGGGNSHMAIRAKEFGLPAAIGVGEALYKSLSCASIIELDVTNRKIEVIR